MTGERKHANNHVRTEYFNDVRAQCVKVFQAIFRRLAQNPNRVDSPIPLVARHPGYGRRQPARPVQHDFVRKDRVLDAMQADRRGPRFFRKQHAFHVWPSGARSAEVRGASLMPPKEGRRRTGSAANYEHQTHAKMTVHINYPVRLALRVVMPTASADTSSIMRLPFDRRMARLNAWSSIRVASRLAREADRRWAARAVTAARASDRGSCQVPEACLA